MSKMLFITQLLPYPVNTGGKYKTFHILQQLAKSHQVHLYSFHDSRNDQQYVKILAKKLKIKVKSIYWPIVTAQHQRIKFQAVLSAFSLKPFAINQYFSYKMRDELEKISKQLKFDIVYCDHDTSLQYLCYIHRHPNIKSIYDEHNINYQTAWRKVKFMESLKAKVFYGWDAIKYYFYEKSHLQKVDAVFTISDFDRAQINEMGIKVPMLTLPVPAEPSSQFSWHSLQLILIPATMSWPPNKQGILWFASQVFPLVQKSLPKIKLALVGPNPEKEIVELERNNNSIQVTGEVDSLLDYYRQSSLVVAPIFMGSGVRIKILDALAHGLPVVSTSIGARGLPHIRESGIVIADSSQLMASKIVKLITDPKNLKIKSKLGIKYIKKYFNAKQTQRTFDQILK